MTVTGWDIGGVNTKAARVTGGRVAATAMRPYELQRAPGRLAEVLRALAEEVGAGPAPDACAVTMTAELSQIFRTKREGVAFVLGAAEAAFPAACIRVFTTGGAFVGPDAARTAPLSVAAANWAATARAAARHHRDALLVDVGTTTTDVIPIAGGRVVAAGRTDPERLASGELVYTGAVRTPAEAMASAVPLGGQRAGVSAEGFALSGDVHVWRGELDPADYSWPTPDGRPASRTFAAERLARVVCADLEMLDERAIDAIAGALAGAQVRRVAEAIRRVAARHPPIRVAIVTGVGAFIAARAAREAGLAVVPLAVDPGVGAAAQCAAAASVALLYESARARGEPLDGGERHGQPGASGPHALSERDGRSESTALLVVKLGGGVLPHAERFEAALHAIARTARERPLLVVPGGGPFADAVRDVDRQVGLADDAAHWMAVLAMDQYAHLIASRLGGGTVVSTRAEVEAALAAEQVAVLAPSRWLREADPLPHSWDVTSDSIAAWVAGQVGAEELLLIKPPGAPGAGVVDAYFSKALPPGIRANIVPAERLAAAFV